MRLELGGAHRLVVTCAALTLALAGSAFATVPPKKPVGDNATGGNPDIMVLNRYQSPIYSIQASPVSSTDWGNERLSSGDLADGQRVDVVLERGQCKWDFRVKYRNGRREEKRNQNTCETNEITFNGSSAKVVASIVNHASVAIDRVGAWSADPAEADRNLASNPIQPSKKYEIYLDPAKCEWNLRVRYHDGRTEEKLAQNLCNTYEIGFDHQAAKLVVPLANRSQVAIDQVFASPTDGRTWGSNRIASALVPGKTFDLRLESDSCDWDLRVYYQDGRAEEKRGQKLCEATEIVFDGSGAERVLHVTNRATIAIDEIYVSPAGGGQNWGGNRIIGPLAPGKTQDLDFDPSKGCQWDLRVKFHDGKEERRLDQDLCAHADQAFGAMAPPVQTDVPPPSPGPLVVRLVNRNRAGLAIEEIHVSRAAAADQWGGNELGGITLPANGSQELRLDRSLGCKWHLKVVYASHFEEERRDLDLCLAKEVVFDGSGARMPARQPEASVAPEATIVNDGPALVSAVFARPASESEWGENRLTGGLLRAGRRFALNLPRNKGCNWRLKIVFVGDAPKELAEQNLCQQHDLAVSGKAAPGQVISSALGFYVSRAGHVLTSFEAMRDCASVVVARPGGRITLERLGGDEPNDLALFAVPNLVSPSVTFRNSGDEVSPGDRVLFVGPPPSARGAAAVVDGLVSARVGPHGHATQLQFTGGATSAGAPVFDEEGLLIGVVMPPGDGADPRRPDASHAALKRDAVLSFLRQLRVEPVEAPAGDARPITPPQLRIPSVLVTLQCLT